MTVPFLALALVALSSVPQEPPGDDPVVVTAESVPQSVVPPVPVPSPSPKPRLKPKVSLRCSPAISNAQYTERGFRSSISCTVFIENPDERLWCPEVAWAFEERGQPISSHESDCAPFSEAGEIERWSEGPKFFGLPPGTYQIWALLKKSGKVVGRDYFVVRVS